MRSLCCSVQDPTVQWQAWQGELINACCIMPAGDQTSPGLHVLSATWRAQQQDPSTCFQLSHQMSWQRVREGMSAPAQFALSGEAKLLESGCCSRLRQTPPDPGCSMPQQRNQTSLLHIPEGVSAPAQCPLSPGRWLQLRQPQLQNPVQQQPPSRIAAQPVPGVLDCQAAARTLTAAGVPLIMRYCMSSSHDKPKHRRP
jgi:hypothetical protein